MLTYLFSLNRDSAAGPDGFTRKFFTHCWEIIGNDLYAAVLEFFAGFNFPRSWTSTRVVTIPKVDNPSSFKDLRPISLCNFYNKIISKLLATHLACIFPVIISENQSGFVKGRVIQDNILLAQELMHHLSKRVSGSNIAIKLDMAKAFDKVSWFFLIKVLRKIGFHEIFIDQIWLLISDN